MFKSAWDAALPVYAIGTALVMVFSSLLKTDERRSSVTLWGRSAQSQTPNKLHLPGNSRWCGTPFASVSIETVYFDGKLMRPSSLIRCHGNFWAGSGLSVIIRLSYKECPFLTTACFNYANLAASLLATKAWLSCFQRKRQRGRPENAIKARPKRMARPSPNKFFAKFALEIFRRGVT